MIDIETRNSAFGQVHYRMIDILNDWMVSEKRNLEGFINDPEGHADYNAYMVFDIPALSERATILGEIDQCLSLISNYKKGNTDITKSMHDHAIGSIPYVIWKRLYDWIEKRAEEMEQFLVNAKNNPPVPISDYQGLATFNTAKYIEELNIYKASRDGLAVLLEYMTQH